MANTEPKDSAAAIISSHPIAAIGLALGSGVVLGLFFSPMNLIKIGIGLALRRPTVG